MCTICSALAIDNKLLNNDDHDGRGGGCDGSGGMLKLALVLVFVLVGKFRNFKREAHTTR